LEAEEKTLAEQVVNRTKAGLDEHMKRVPVYNRAYDVYRASGRSPDGTEPWQSKLRVKYAMYNLDTALVNIVGGAPRARVYPRSPETEDRAKAMQSVLDYYADRCRLADLQAQVAQQAIVYGVTVGKTSWLYREGERMKRRYEPSPLGDGMIAFQPKPEKVVQYDGPWFEPWDVYDAWWDPFARSVDTASYVVLRSWPSKQELLQQKHLYQNLEELFQTGDATDRNQTAQDRRMQAERPMRGRFEIWEVWTDDRLIVLGNKQVVIRDIPNPHWHGEKPIVIATGRPDLFKLQGIPETELVEHLQEALWTLQNMRFDNLKLTVMRGLTYREGGVVDPNMLVLRPRFRWPVSDHDDVQFQAPPPLPTEAYTEERSLIDQMQTVTGISPYVSGNVPSSVSHTTATSVSLLQNAATRLLQFKGTMLNNLCWQRVFEQWGQDVQQFMTEPLYARIVQGDQTTFQKVEPWQVQGEYDYRIVGADEQSSKDQERSQAVQLLQALAPFAQAINYKPLVERVAAAFDLPDPDALLATPQAQPMAAPQPNGGTGLPPSQGGQTAPQSMSAGGVQLPPGVEQAILGGGMSG
jgi:hypothetical protein